MRQSADRAHQAGSAIQIYDENMFRERQHRHRVNLQVRQAYEERRFFLHFQPILDLEQQRLGGAEALLRMRDRDGHEIAASDFFSAIDRIGFQSIIDEWVFGEFVRLCCENECARQLLETEGFAFGLNASPAFLSNPGMADSWLRRLAQAGICPGKIVVELIENPVLLLNQTLIGNLQEMRRAGIRIAVDDFGSGYSNLRHLTKLPVDIVKLDRAFLAELDDSNQRGRVLMTSMIALCRALGYLSLVEGVESAAQDAFLRGTSCHYAQGYYYGKPMPLAELLSLARRYIAA
jgi:EAL domain-containing protein (putative c-di-GMP-specific phosphodiesterase class I)